MAVTPSTRLIFSTDTGSISVQPGSQNTVDVGVFIHGSHALRDVDDIRREFTLKAEQNGNNLTITCRFQHDWTFWVFPWSWARDLEFRVTIPQKMTADIATSGGPISLADLGGEINARTSGGPIRMERTLGKTSVHTSGGPIAISDAKGPVDASTSGGPINASFAAQPSEACRLVTSGGPIQVTLPHNVHMDLDASTAGGGVWTDFPMGFSQGRHSSQLRGPLNGGGPLLYLHTSGGRIVVRRAEGGRDLGPVY